MVFIFQYEYITLHVPFFMQNGKKIIYFKEISKKSLRYLELVTSFVAGEVRQRIFINSRRPCLLFFHLTFSYSYLYVLLSKYA